MLQERVDEISFYEALALIVKRSGLKQIEIVRRSNARLAEMIERTEIDPFLRSLLELVSPLDKSTVSNVLKGKDLVSALTLYRICLAFDLDEETLQWLQSRFGMCAQTQTAIYDWLEVLRQQEEPRNHSTAYRRIVLMTGGTKPLQTDDDDLPPWIHQQ